MKKGYLILQAAEAIANRLYPGPTSYCVGTVENLIVCVPIGQTPPGFKLVHQYHAQMLDVGLSAAHWSELEKALITHFVRNKL